MLMMAFVGTALLYVDFVGPLVNNLVYCLIILRLVHKLLSL